jgi:hypothetical protein
MSIGCFNDDRVDAFSSRAHWHGEIAVRLIEPSGKINDVEYLNLFKNQVCSNARHLMFVNLLIRCLAFEKFDMNISIFTLAFAVR